MRCQNASMEFEKEVALRNTSFAPVADVDEDEIDVKNHKVLGCPRELEIILFQRLVPDAVKQVVVRVEIG